MNKLQNTMLATAMVFSSIDAMQNPTAISIEMPNKRPLHVINSGPDIATVLSGPDWRFIIAFYQNKHMYPTNTGKDLDSFLFFMIDYASDLDIIKKVIAAGGSVKAVDSQTGDTLLHSAIQKEKNSVIEFLIKSMKMDIHTTNNIGANSFHYAVASRNIDLVKEMIEMDPNIVNSPNNEGETPLFYAISSDSAEEMIKLLILNRANPAIVSKKGQTLLHQAALRGAHKLIKTLTTEINLANGDINTKNTDGKTALALAEEIIYNDLTIAALREAGVTD